MSDVIVETKNRKKNITYIFLTFLNLLFIQDDSAVFSIN